MAFVLLSGEIVLESPEITAQEMPNHYRPIPARRARRIAVAVAFQSLGVFEIEHLISSQGMTVPASIATADVASVAGRMGD